MTKRVVIHAGLPKCGSTSLQLRLANARRALMARGIAYPLTERAMGRPVLDAPGLDAHAPQHVTLAAALEGPSPPDTLAELLGTFERSGAHTLVLSSESFGPRARHYAAASFTPLRDYAVEVVAFTRRRDDWLLAMYKQALRTWRRRYRGSFGRWLSDPPAYDRHTAALEASEAAARLAALTGGRWTVFDLEPQGAAPPPDTGVLMGQMLDVPLEQWPDWPERLGPLRGAERRRGLRVNATHSDAAALFLAMIDRDAVDEAAMRDLVGAVVEPGFGDAAPPISILTPEVSAALLAGGAGERERLGFVPVAPRSFPPGTVFRETLTVPEWRVMAERLVPRLEPALAAQLRAASVRELG